MTIKIIGNEKDNPPGKLADVELHFDAADGVLEGLKLMGFAIWERRTGARRNVTFPARQYSMAVSDGASRCCAPSSTLPVRTALAT